MQQLNQMLLEDVVAAAAADVLNLQRRNQRLRRWDRSFILFATNPKPREQINRCFWEDSSPQI